MLADRTEYVHLIYLRMPVGVGYIPYAEQHIPLKKRTSVRPAELDSQCQNSCYLHSIAWFHQYKKELSKR
jgi:hypothetical protein